MTPIPKFPGLDDKLYTHANGSTLRKFRNRLTNQYCLQRHTQVLKPDEEKPSRKMSIIKVRMAVPPQGGRGLLARRHTQGSIGGLAMFSSTWVLDTYFVIIC